MSESEIIYILLRILIIFVLLVPLLNDIIDNQENYIHRHPILFTLGLIFIAYQLLATPISATYKHIQNNADWTYLGSIAIFVINLWLTMAMFGVMVWIYKKFLRGICTFIFNFLDYLVRQIFAFIFKNHH
ncbi:MAG: hypothetical protein K5978_03400 [Campylobacter sp.]|nr:hypothetical protein [Campylobacter sp.]